MTKREEAARKVADTIIYNQPLSGAQQNDKCQAIFTGLLALTTPDPPASGACDCGKSPEACAATEDCSGQSMPDATAKGTAGVSGDGAIRAESAPYADASQVGATGPVTPADAGEVKRWGWSLERMAMQHDGPFVLYAAYLREKAAREAAEARANEAQALSETRRLLMAGTTEACKRQRERAETAERDLAREMECTARLQDERQHWKSCYESAVLDCQARESERDQAWRELDAIKTGDKCVFGGSLYEDRVRERDQALADLAAANRKVEETQASAEAWHRDYEREMDAHAVTKCKVEERGENENRLGCALYDAEQAIAALKADRDKWQRSAEGLNAIVERVRARAKRWRGQVTAGFWADQQVTETYRQTWNEFADAVDEDLAAKPLADQREHRERRSTAPAEFVDVADFDVACVMRADGRLHKAERKGPVVRCRRRADLGRGARKSEK